ncbi:MAG: hypothetical protein OMM_03822 [Candidatus Magnetoglobus multicellularis str. Araruama]|uniref:Orc1-like AAA ATPase domain-containing protein n=1 Tax=Candidatus Magnetoglobus multicellularis str. Araruama TaxID=890399 RepID=A0A1V1P4G4_9BACT|nr:MAG: hypothetical protein OMM_03822 [Candidatus Magnetoglobus multicellularis str. Araruama]
MAVLTNLIPRLELIIGRQKQTFISGFIENHNLFNSVFCKFLKAISQEKELIILFDDIQWMDSASKKLLMTILQYKALSNCTILLTSINNQFHQVLSGMTASGKLPYLSLHHMKIDNISVQDISDLLYDSFRFSPDLCQKFSKLLHSKTRGNVSFLHQILVKLHSEGLIQFDKGASQWLVNLKK